MKIRIHIREQLCLIFAVTTLLALTVLAVSTFLQSRHYLQESREQTLQVTANLKADQIAQDLRLFQEAVQTVTTRDNLQAFVKVYDNGNTSQALRDALAVSLQDVSLCAAESAIHLTQYRIISITPLPTEPKMQSICKLLYGLAIMVLVVR